MKKHLTLIFLIVTILVFPQTQSNRKLDSIRTILTKRTVVRDENGRILRNIVEEGSIVEEGYFEKNSSFKIDLKIERKNGKIGFKDNTKKLIVDYIYDYANYINSNLICVKQNGLYGFIDAKGKQITPCIYNYFEPNLNVVIVVQNGNYMILDNNAKLLIDERFEKAWFLNSKNICIKKYGKWDILNMESKALLKYSFDQIGNISRNFAVVESNKKYGILNIKTLKIDIPIECDNIGKLYKDKYIVLQKSNQKGVFDLKNNEILPFSETKSINIISDDFVTYINSDNKTVLLRLSDKKIIMEFDAVDNYIGNYMFIRNVNKYGLIKKTGEVIMPVQYDGYEYEGEHLLYNLTINGKCALFDTTGKQLTPFDFDYISPVSFLNKHKIKNGVKFGFYNIKNKKTDYLDYNWIGNYTTDSLVIVYNGHNFGFIDAKYKVRIPLEYSNANKFHNKKALVKKDRSVFFINKKGEQINDSTYEDMDLSYYDNFHAVKKNNVWGYVDEDNNTVFPFEYDYATGFKYGFAIASKNKKYGTINTSNRNIIPFNYDDLNFVQGFGLVAKKDKEYGVLDFSGKALCNFEYSDIKSYSENGLLKVKKNGKSGYIDRNSNIVIPIIYDFACGIDTMFLVKKNIEDKTICKKQFALDDFNNEKTKTKHGLYNRNGKIILDTIYDELNYSDDYKYFFVKKEDKYCILNKRFEKITDYKFDNIEKFKNNFAIATINGKYGYIDTLGNTVIDFKFDKAFDFSLDNTAEVEINGSSSVIDRKGNILYKKDKGYADSFKNGLSIVKRNNKYGIIDKSNKTVVPFEYSDIYSTKNENLNNGELKNCYIVSMEGCRTRGYKDRKTPGIKRRVKGIIDGNNNIIIPLRYTNLSTYGFPPNVIRATIDSKRDIIDKNKDDVIPFIATNLLPRNGKIVFKCGLIDYKGNILLDTIYENIDTVNNGYIAQKDSVSYLFSKDFKLLKKFDFLISAYNFNKDYNYLTIHSKDYKKEGIVDKDFNKIIDIKYEDISPILNDMFIVKESNKLGIINKKGVKILDIKFENINPISNDRFIVELNKKWGIIDVNGNEVLPFEYKSIQEDDHNPDVLLLRKDTTMALLNKTTLKAIVQFGEYERIFYCDKNVFEVRKNKKSGLINEKGEIVFPLSVTNIYKFNKFYVIETKDKKGLLNENFKAIFEPQFDYIDKKDNGYIQVRKNDKFGLLDSLGNWVVPIKYNNWIEFDSGTVVLNRTEFYNLKGEKVPIPQKYLSEGLFQFIKNGKRGFVDANYNEVIPCIYDSTEDFSEGICFVVKDGKWGFINKKGETVIPFTDWYDHYKCMID